jgi:hypothetical protein
MAKCQKIFLDIWISFELCLPALPAGRQAVGRSFEI